MTVEPSNSAGCGGIGPAGKIHKFGTSVERKHYIFDLVDSADQRAEAAPRPEAKQLVNAGPTQVRIDQQYTASPLRQDQR